MHATRLHYVRCINQFDNICGGRGVSFDRQRWTKITVDTIYCGLYITQVARRSSILDLSSLSGYDMAATENLYYHVMEVDIRNGHNHNVLPLWPRIICYFPQLEIPYSTKSTKFTVNEVQEPRLTHGSYWSLNFTSGFALIEYNSDPAFTSIIADKSEGHAIRNYDILVSVHIPRGPVKDLCRFVLWNSNDLGLLLSTSAIAYNASAPLLGLVYYFTQRYKPFYVWDVFSLLGLCALAAYLFTIQALIGFGIIAVDMGTLISAQASVAHDDLATVTALLAVSSQLATSVGNVVGTASSVWMVLPDQSLAHGSGSINIMPFLSLFVPNYILGKRA
ncbi:hypothetical protein RhiXN_03257 [Rhizoctonia solani]|uniref:Uncharacterized protein n=1 Tax=Rhizoctonia solani TaxID=456999 RepID=A0A8H8NT67_9AGAM|nr:uncharacterized protein RhiXN_03257 [Rhizoctonia solani]QRW18333.1 hypothetical protein RhiXN_03257 [Rhizoctonia solani]